jgi:hypothetical protein
MADFNVRSDAVDVEQIMRQIRARIREKRGADYTEQELQQLATVKLEKFLDPRGVRSDLVNQFKRHRTVSPEPPKYEFEDTTLYDTHRGLLRFMRKLLHPILKLFINPNPLIQALHTQKQVNDEFHKRFRQREEMDPLYYEVVHNLVMEITRLGIDVHNLKMRVESLSSRMDFDERRSRSLESVVQSRQPQRPPQSQPASPGGPRGQGGHRGQERSHQPVAPQGVSGVAPTGAGTTAPRQSVEDVDTAPAAVASSTAPAANGGTESSQQGLRPDDQRRKRRRRRRRRPGQNLADSPNAGAASPAGQGTAAIAGAAAAGGFDDGDVGNDGNDDGGDDGNDPDSGATDQ